MKIFCIGAHKTGTTSLNAAMNKLNYKCFPEEIGYTGLMKDGKIVNTVNHMIDVIKNNDEKYDFFQDIPFNLFDNYKILDRAFKESKFILTVRDSDEWFKSMIRWIEMGNTVSGKKRRKLIYSYIYKCTACNKNKDRIIRVYEKRNKDIIEYFAKNNKQDMLLIMNLSEGDSWDKLCKFLEFKGEINISDEPFPHENKGKTK